MKTLHLAKTLGCCARAALALAACAAFQNASAACYNVYGADGKLLYRSVHSPVDLEPPLGETVPELEPGGATMVFTPDSFDCISGEVNVWESRKEMARARKSPKKKTPPAPLMIPAEAPAAAPSAGEAPPGGGTPPQTPSAPQS